jgi:hypothetical protein
VVAPKPWKPPTPVSTATWPGYQRALRDDPAGVARVLEESGPFFENDTDLAWAIEIESGWDPHALNAETKAGGLIQMMPSTQKGMGIVNVHKSERSEQSPLIRQFFLRNGLASGHIGTVRRPGDALLAIFAPRHIDKPDEFVVFAEGSAGWRANPSYRSKDGPITAGSVRRAGTPRAMRPRPKGPPKGPPPKPGVEGSGGGGVLLAILLVGALVVLDDAG